MKVGKHEFEQLVWIVVLIAAFSAIGFLLYKHLDIPIRDEYNGIIRDKWAAYSHLDQGSFVNYRLLVESESGERFKVVVDFETFRRAEIGMRIKRSKSGIELGNSQSRPLSFGVIELTNPWTATRLSRDFPKPPAFEAVSKIGYHKSIPFV